MSIKKREFKGFRASAKTAHNTLRGGSQMAGLKQL